jgi:hypothetical protein
MVRYVDVRLDGLYCALGNDIRRVMDDTVTLPVAKSDYLRLRKVNLDLFIQQANEILMRSNGTTPVTIEGSLIRVPYHARDEFKAAFRQAGWTVEYTSDQRDGDYWRFS